MSKNYNQQSSKGASMPSVVGANNDDQGQAGEYGDSKLDSSV
jgi:hypothetical protein